MPAVSSVISSGISTASVSVSNSTPVSVSRITASVVSAAGSVFCPHPAQPISIPVIRSKIPACFLFMFFPLSFFLPALYFISPGAICKQRRNALSSAAFPLLWQNRQLPAREPPVSAPLTSVYMFMRKQMILTIFVISFTFGTETELQIRIIQFCSAADRAFVLRDLCPASALPGTCPVCPAPVYLMRRVTLQVFGRKIKDQEV